MSPGPTRLFNGSSRVANTIPYKKPTPGAPSELQTTGSKSMHKLVLNHGSSEDAPRDCATPTMTALDLGLPPFTSEFTSDYNHDVKVFTDDLSFNAPIDEGELEDEQGMPTRAQWEIIVDSYLTGLHPRKRDKALITQNMHEMIFRTLVDPDATRLGTPQFRFWARKMFELVDAAGALVITNGGRPVAVKEHIYDILCMCHAESGHAGRDKTCKILREYYTWIPKELTANFVKACPTCMLKRAGEMDVISRLPVKRGSEVIDDVPSAQQLPFRKSESPASPSHFSVSVETLEDFGRNADFKPILPPKPEIFGLGPPQLSRRDKFPLRSSTALGSPLSPSLSFACLPPPDESYPLPSWSSNSNITLPPLVSNSLKDKDSNAKLEYSAENGRMILPPLMQYLSQDIDEELQIPRDFAAQRSRTHSPAANIPIDPVLLAQETCASRTEYSDDYHTSCELTPSVPDVSPPSAIELLMHPPTPQWADQRSALPLEPLDLSLVDTDGVYSGAWEYQSAEDCHHHGGRSLLLSASSAESAGVCTPSSGQVSPTGYGAYHPFPQDFQPQPHEGSFCAEESKEATPPPLYSPVPVKFEDTNAMLELATTASLGLVTD